jgi:hypothetical protein
MTAITLHVSDYDGVDERHWMAEEGIIDWKAVVAALRQANYQGPFLFETNKHKDGTPLKPSEMVDFLRKINADADKQTPEPSPPKTEILKWKDGRRAVFMLEFDDSCESHVKFVIPELKKRNMVGTFYVNPGNGPFKKYLQAWEKEIPGMGMEYGNHTFTHVGALSVAEWDQEPRSRCSRRTGT